MGNLLSFGESAKARQEREFAERRAVEEDRQARMEEIRQDVARINRLRAAAETRRRQALRRVARTGAQNAAAKARRRATRNAERQELRTLMSANHVTNNNAEGQIVISPEGDLRIANMHNLGRLAWLLRKHLAWFVNRFIQIRSRMEGDGKRRLKAVVTMYTSFVENKLTLTPGKGFIINNPNDAKNLWKNYLIEEAKSFGDYSKNINEKTEDRELKDIPYDTLGERSINQFTLTFRNADLIQGAKLDTLTAFGVSHDRNYIGATMLSTINKELCIYETFYITNILTDRIVKEWRSWKIACRTNAIGLAFEAEPEEIQEAVLSGNVCLSLNLLCAKYECEFYMYMYKSKKCNFSQGIIFPVEIDSISMIGEVAPQFLERVTREYKDGTLPLGGLYHQHHMAPYDVVAAFKAERATVKEVVAGKNKVRRLTPHESSKKVTATLTRTKSYARKFITCAFDIETQLRPDVKIIADVEKNVYNHIPFLGCSIVGDDERVFYGYDCMSDFVTYVMNDLVHPETHKKRSRKKKKVPEYRFYAHNGAGFDYIFLLNAFYEQHIVPQVVMAGSMVMFMKIGNVTFVDSNRICPGKLRDLAEKFNLPLQKTHFPYYFPTTENITNGYDGEVPAVEFWKDPESHIEFLKDWPAGKSWNMADVSIEYCLQDVRVLVQVMDCFLATCHGKAPNGVMFDVRSSITAAGSALAEWKQWGIPEDTTYYAGSLDVQDAIRDSLYGGLTGNLKLHVESNGDMKYYYYDSNSHYPAMMCKMMPIVTKNTKLMLHDDDVMTVFNSHSLYRVKVVYPEDSFEHPIIANLQTRDESGALRNPIDQSDKWRWHWGIELTLAIKMHAVVTSSGFIPFGRAPVFKAFIQEKYKARCEIKKEIKRINKLEGVIAHLIAPLEAESARLKLGMNTLFGKTCQRKYPTNVFVSDVEYKQLLSENYMNDFKAVWVPTIEKWSVSYQDTQNNNRSAIGNFCHWGSFITALGRTALVEMMMMVGFENVVYHDTDSVIFKMTDEGQANIQPILSQSELGLWSNELKFGNWIDEVITLGPKMYCYLPHGGKWEFHMKGIPKGLLKDPEVYRKLMVEGATHKFLLKEMWNRKLELGADDGVSIVRDCVREIKRQLGKRVWDEFGNSKSQLTL